jgi:hypothetical protein
LLTKAKVCVGGVPGPVRLSGLASSSSGRRAVPIIPLARAESAAALGSAPYPRRPPLRPEPLLISSWFLGSLLFLYPLAFSPPFSFLVGPHHPSRQEMAYKTKRRISASSSFGVRSETEAVQAVSIISGQPVGETDSQITGSPAPAGPTKRNLYVRSLPQVRLLPPPG